MDLSYGGRYETFRKGVERFLEEHGADAPSGLGGLGAKPGPDALRWQRLLVEHGYVARTIPREYGGFGAEPDLLESTIIDEVFTASRLSRGIGGQGPEMLVPTLLAHASEEQKQRWIRPTLRAELIW